MAGHDIVIAKAGKPMVRLVPVVRDARRRGFGADKGRIRSSDDFDAALPSDVLRSFGIDP